MLSNKIIKRIRYDVGSYGRYQLQFDIMYSPRHQGYRDALRVD